MAYYYELLNDAGEFIDQSSTPYNTMQDALIAARTVLVINEAHLRIYTQPPIERDPYSIPVFSEVISRRGEYIDVFSVEVRTRIVNAVRDRAVEEQRKLTPAEIEETILKVTGWNPDIDTEAEALAEAFAFIEYMEAIIYTRPLENWDAR